MGVTSLQKCDAESPGSGGASPSRVASSETWQAKKGGKTSTRTSTIGRGEGAPPYQSPGLHNDLFGPALGLSGARWTGLQMRMGRLHSGLRRLIHSAKPARTMIKAATIPRLPIPTRRFRLLLEIDATDGRGKAGFAATAKVRAGKSTFRSSW
jgi:hypothetical protein